MVEDEAEVDDESEVDCESVVEDESDEAMVDDEQVHAPQAALQAVPLLQAA